MNKITKKTKLSKLIKSQAADHNKTVWVDKKKRQIFLPKIKPA